MIIISVFQGVKDRTVSSGVGKLAYGIFERLRLKYDTKIYFSSKGNLNDSFIYDFGSLYKLLFKIIRLAHFILPNHYIRYTQEILYDVFLYFRIDKNVKVLITTNAWIPITTKYLKNRNVKIILIAGNPNDNDIYNIIKLEKTKLGKSFIDVYDFKPRLNRYNKFLNDVDVVIAINNYIYNSFYKNKYSNNYKIILIPTIFDTDFTLFDVNKKHNDIFTILYCAHTTTLKGLHFLIKVFNDLIDNNFKINLFVAGGIDENIKDIIKKYQNTHIKYFGNIKPKVLAELLGESDVFVIPSLCDAGPVTLVEAMYSKSVVITSNNVGNQWLISHGSDGFIFDLKTDSLFDILVQTYSSREMLLEMGDKAKSKIIKVNNEKNTFYIEIEKLILNENTLSR